MDSTECAVWFFSHHAPDFETFADEQEAARYAANMQDEGRGVVSGVQFADGRLVERKRWAAMDEVQRESDAAYQRLLDENAANPPVRREVTDPFSGRTVSADEPFPGWVGKRG